MTPPPRRRLGDILIERGVLTEQELQLALERQRDVRARLGVVLVKMGLARAEVIADALAEHLGIPRADWSQLAPDSELTLLVPSELLAKKEVFPLRQEGNRLVVAMADPLDIYTMDALRQASGLVIEPAVATEEEIEAAYDRTFSLSAVAQEVMGEIEVEGPDPEPDPVVEPPIDSPGVRVVDLIIVQAVRERASDIHIEPREKNVLVRYRIDGVLHEEMQLPKHIQSDVTLRLKVMAGLDITERRRPQDGRIRVTIGEQPVDIRVSILPTIYGEKVVLRILDRSTAVLELAESGFLATTQVAVENMLRVPHGLILLTGPTGSGKTTTQYALLNELNTPDRNIITVEDPVEYRLHGINQVQVNPRLGVDFATSLRAVLRQDPDVVVVGEIRDQETAEIAVRAALTGHLVLATLHTNSACATPTRLVDMGILPFLVSATLLGVISQRLMRRICVACKEEMEITNPAELQFLAAHGVHTTRLWRGRGCPMCRQTGYKGRVPVEEVLTISHSLRRLLGEKPQEEELLAAARADGFRTIAENGLEKVVAGVSTLEELWRAVYSLHDDTCLT